MDTLLQSSSSTTSALRDDRGKRAAHFISPLTLRQNFSWVFIGTLVSTACRWGILVAFTQLGSPEMLGSYALAIGICTPIFTLCNVNLRSVQAIDTRSEYDFSSYLSLRLLTTLLAVVITGGIALLSGYDKNMLMIILLVGIAKSSESLSDLFHGLFQRVERMDYSATSMALNGVVSLIAVSLALYFTHSLLAVVVALASAWLLLLLAVDFHRGLLILATEAPGEVHLGDAAVNLFRSLRAQIGSPTIYQLALVALPLGVGTFLCSLNANIPRYVIAIHIGERGLGYFTALASATIAINMIVRSLGTSMIPTLARCLACGDENKFLRHVARNTFLAFAVGATAVLIASLLGKSLLRYIFGAEYTVYTKLFTALMVVGTFSAIATTLSLATTAARLFRGQAVIYGLNTIFILGSCWLLVPRYALWGAAIAIGAAAILRVALYAFLLGSVMRRHAPPSSLWLAQSHF
jgi:O-antigen/teichoic acid export membrane protein